MIGVLCLLKCPRKFEANGGFALRVASPQRPPFVLPRRPLFPSMRATGASPELVVGATPPLMASRRRHLGLARSASIHNVCFTSICDVESRAPNVSFRCEVHA